MSAEATEVRQGRDKTRAGKVRLLSLKDMDARTAAYHRFKELLNDYTSDVGGDPSTAQSAIIQRAVSLQVWCEDQEASYAATGDLDVSTFTTATNTLRRLLTDIGLDRRARDVTPGDRIRELLGS